MSSEKRGDEREQVHTPTPTQQCENSFKITRPNSGDSQEP